MDPYQPISEESTSPNELSDLDDVQTSSLSHGHELRFSATSNTFENADPHAVYNGTSKSVVVGSSMDVSAAVECIAIGNESLVAAVSGAEDNVAIGDDALKSLTTGQDNVAVGSDALESIVTGSKSTAVGRKALSSCDSADNVGVGSDAGRYLTGEECTFVGSGAGEGYTTGNRCIMIGKDCGKDVGAGAGTGSNNLVVGNGVPALTNSGMIALFNGDLNSGHLPTTLIGDNVMVLGGSNITDAVLCGGSLPTSSAGRKTGALFTDANGMVRCNITSPNTVFTVTQPTNTLDTLKVQCTNGDCVLKLSSEVDGNDATLTASHTDNSLTIAATQSANIVFKTNGSEGMAVMNNQNVRFKNFIRWTGSFSNVAAAGTPSTRSMAWIGNDIGIYDTTNGWRKISTESF
jgi:hypothetical protein